MHPLSGPECNKADSKNKTKRIVLKQRYIPRRFPQRLHRDILPMPLLQLYRSPKSTIHSAELLFQWNGSEEKTDTLKRNGSDVTCKSFRKKTMSHNYNRNTPAYPLRLRLEPRCRASTNLQPAMYTELNLIFGILSW